MSDFLERELQRRLAPVAAPDGLWDKRLLPTPGPARWNPGKTLLLSPVLALIVITVAAGAVWKTGLPQSRLTASPQRIGVKANQKAGAFNASCVMCHTGATLYVSPR